MAPEATFESGPESEAENEAVGKLVKIEVVQDEANEYDLNAPVGCSPTDAAQIRGAITAESGSLRRDVNALTLSLR